MFSVPSPSLHRDWHEVPPPIDSVNLKLSTYPSQARSAAVLHVLLVAAAVNDPRRVVRLMTVTRHGLRLTGRLGRVRQTQVPNYFG